MQKKKKITLISARNHQTSKKFTGSLFSFIHAPNNNFTSHLKL